MNPKQFAFGCLSLIAITAWTIFGLAVFFVMYTLTIVALGEGSEDDPLVLLVLIPGFLVAFIGAVWSVRWLRRKYGLDASS